MSSRLTLRPEEPGALRVAVVHNLKVGGAHRRLYEQMRHLEGRVNFVECVLESAAPVTSNPILVPVHVAADRAPSWKRPAHRYTDIGHLMAAYRRLARIVASLRLDAVWLNPDNRIQAPWVGPELARKSFYYCDEPRRFDYDKDTIHTTRRLTRIPYWPVRRLERALDRSTATRVPVIATNSHYTADAIRSAYGVNPEIVPCGISEVFSPGPSPERAHLLSVGTLIPAKGHDLVLQAAAQSGLGLPVHIVSHREDGGERQRLERLAASLRVALTIHIDVTDLQLRDLYRGAFATLYLAEREPFGLVSLEAQACGSPVIVAAEGGLPETLVDGVSGYVVARGTTEAAERLKMLAADVALRARLSSYGPKTRHAWTWGRSADHVAECLVKVAS
jgi:glycosyltransferase involved in cell wall biosynthesis